MDVIALHQAGFGAAVAPLGTALTEEQLGELWRLSPMPTLCFDGDAAGARAAALVAAVPISPNVVIISTSDLLFPKSGTKLDGIWLPPPDRRAIEQANCFVRCVSCPHQLRYLELVASQPIQPGDKLILPWVEDADSLGESLGIIAQFDGSCRMPGTDLASCGAGLAFWKSDHGETTLVQQIAIPLPTATTAAEAEAMAAAAALQELLQVLQQLQPRFIEVQGDNAAVVGHWTGTSRFHTLRMHSLLEDALHIATFQLPQIQWKYIPRECNATADRMAGLASSVMLEARKTITDAGNPPHMPDLVPPRITPPIQTGELSSVFWQTLKQACLNHDSLLISAECHSPGIATDLPLAFKALPVKQQRSLAA